MWNSRRKPGLSLENRDVYALCVEPEYKLYSNKPPFFFGLILLCLVSPLLRTMSGIYFVCNRNLLIDEGLGENKRCGSSTSPLKTLHQFSSYFFTQYVPSIALPNAVDRPYSFSIPLPGHKASLLKQHGTKSLILKIGNSNLLQRPGYFDSGV